MKVNTSKTHPGKCPEDPGCTRSEGERSPLAFVTGVVADITENLSCYLNNVMGNRDGFFLMLFHPSSFTYHYLL